MSTLITDDRKMFLLGMLYCWVLLLSASCMQKPKTPEYTLLHTDIFIPPRYTHDLGTTDVITIGIRNETPNDVYIPRSGSVHLRFRWVYLQDTFPLAELGDNRNRFWTLFPGESDSILLTTPVRFPQPPDGRDTLDMNTILANGTLQVCLPMDSANCHWTEVKKAESFYFRRGPAE